MTNETILSVQDLTKTYKSGLFGRKRFQALRGVDLEVGRGMVFGLLGPNGAGKTTLVKILLGLVGRYGGQAEIFGERVGRPAPRQRVGYLPEAHRLPIHLTGRQVLIMFGMLCGKDRRWLNQRVDGWLETVDMRSDANRKVREYSKGMAQRIGLAQALIHEPELVVLDEPTDGVDPVGRAAIREVVQNLKDSGVTVFINSHLLMEVELICDRVVIMDKGKIIRAGSIDELTPRTGKLRVELDRAPEDLPTLIAGIGTGLVLNRDAGRHFELAVDDAELDALVDRLRAAGIGIRGLAQQRLSLEESFIDLVKEDQA